MSEGKFIYLAGFGIEKRILLATAKNIREVFYSPVRFSYSSKPVSFGYDPVRKQYCAGKLLEYISRVYFPDMLKLIAIFPFDLYEEGLNFVFGIAQLGGTYAVVSTYRLFDPNERLYFERIFKEVNHELGHSFGLTHCKTLGCVMNFSNSLWEVDAKGRFFCEKCNKILPKP
ncbi:MAG: archaemetzincin family Zn-dependent metalloprotease [Aquificaceae bacterium]|nr:archaemetzincin family Zn-dependent metalloprotease [Aquificaceae bacterium]MCX8164073.1 archaemetzincin family Zn-dependent metalloprotease [Aquificaceae bacterium]